MKRFSICAGLIALSCAVYAQNMSDALNFVRTEQVGTARSLGMGNAMAAIGGDPGSIAINPAASSATTYSQFYFTAGAVITSSTAQGTSLPGSDTPYSFGNRYLKSGIEPAVPNIGFNLYAPTGRKFGLKGFAFSGMLNTSSYSNDRLFTSGHHMGTSFAGAMAARASGVDYNQYANGNSYNNQDWLSTLAWRSGMICTAGSSDSEYVGATEKFIEDQNGNRQFFVAGPLNQEYGRTISGEKTDGILNMSINVSDVFYFGGSLGASRFSYSFDEYISETPVNRDDFEIDFGSQGITRFENLTYSDWYKANGTGSYIKLGLLYTPGMFRVGAAVQTPTFYTVKEQWKSSGQTKFGNSKFNSSDSTPQGSYGYKLNSPWMFTGGLAAVIGKWAVISADYEMDLNSSMRFREVYADDDFTALNRELRENAGMLHKLRAGTEVKPLDCLSVRAGYNLDVLSLTGVSATCNHAASLGFGYSTKGILYFDIACMARFRAKEYIYPYADYDKDLSGNVQHYSPEILNRSRIFTTVFTVGMRF